jgi:hypothetical protein
VNLSAEEAAIAHWWELSLHEVWYLALFVLIFLILVFLLRNRTQLLKMFNTENEEVIALKIKLTTMETYVTQLEQQIKSMQIVINMLLDRSVLIPDIPVPNNPDIVPIIKKRVLKPVLLVYGTESFGADDAQALRRAGVAFFRIRSASLDDLHTELQRRRSDGTLYDVVHISSHGSDKGILFDSELVDGDELGEILSGVRAIFLGTCNNQKIADRLVGIVKYVIVVYEEIDTKLASNFVYEFYKRYKTEMDIEKSFEGAISVMPEVSEFVDLRIGGN